MSAVALQSVPRAESLSELRQALEAAKKAETDANFTRVAIERRVVEHPDMAPQLEAEGTTTVGGLKVTNALARKWDQAALAAASETVRPEFWPFKTEHKEDRRAAKVLEERFPELWAAISPALTLTPRKPTVSLAPLKEGS